MAERVGIPFFKTGNPEQDHERWWVTDFTKEQIETKIAVLEQHLCEAEKATLQEDARANRNQAVAEETQRKLQAAEQRAAAFAKTIGLLTEENLTELIPRMEKAEQRAERYKAALEQIIAMHVPSASSAPSAAYVARAALAEPQETEGK